MLQVFLENVLNHFTKNDVFLWFLKVFITFFGTFFSIAAKTLHIYRVLFQYNPKAHESSSQYYIVSNSLVYLHNFQLKQIKYLHSFCLSVIGNIFFYKKIIFRFIGLWVDNFFVIFNLIVCKKSNWMKWILHFIRDNWSILSSTQIENAF